MKTNQLIRTVLSISIATAVSSTMAATPADPAAGKTVDSKMNATAMPGTPKTSWQDRSRMTQYNDDRELLRKSLSEATSFDELRQMLEKDGYMVTAINEESEDEVEYEVVKGSSSYEVSAEMDDGKLGDIEVEPNLWRAEETERAMADANYQARDVKYDSAMAARSRDSEFRQGWTDEKDALEKAMPIGKPIEAYEQMLKDRGYQITSTNQADDDNVEYEVVKGDQSYEVQLEKDPGSQMVKEVGVSTNMWRSEETEQAMKKQ